MFKFIFLGAAISLAASPAFANGSAEAFFSKANAVATNGIVENILTDVDGNLVGEISGKTCANVHATATVFVDKKDGTEYVLIQNRGCR